VIGRVFDDVLGRLFRAIFEGCLDFTSCLRAGNYRWADQYLIPSGDVFSHRGLGTTSVTLRDGQTLTLAVGINDFDLLNAPDAWCVTGRELHKSLRDWSTTNETITLTDDRGEGSCVINIRVQGRPAR
jgi:hypothetical protein